MLLSTSQRLFDGDVSRHSSIDTRASGLLGAIGIATTLITGIGLTMFTSAGSLPPPAFEVVFCVYIVVLLYLAATAVIALKVQGYIPRSIPDPTDLILPNDDQYIRTLACKLLEYTVENRKVNNVAAELLYSGQKCFRNGLIVLVFGGLTAAIVTAYYSETTPDPSKLAQALAHSAGCTDLPTMKMDIGGTWKGTCLHNGQISSVSVTSGGATSFKP